MVSVCLPSDALSQQLPSYLGFSYHGHGLSLHGCSSKAELLLPTLDEGAPPDPECGVAPLGPPVSAQFTNNSGVIVIGGTLYLLKMNFFF